MNRIGNLIEFFRAHNLDIEEIRENKEINFVIHIIHLYFNIYLWYKTGKIKHFSVYSELLDYNFEDILDRKTNYNLNNIPFELRAKYITFIFEMLSKEGATKDECINSINYLNDMRKIQSKYYYNSIYIINSEYIFIVFIYDKSILIINMNNLNVYEEKNLVDSISMISDILNNKPFFYQFINVNKNNGYMRSYRINV